MARNRIETILAQLGNNSDEKTGAVNPPIYLSTAYQHKSLGVSTGYDYTRTKNPTRHLLEEGMAQLENGDQAFACSSGMAAIQLILSLFRANEELIIAEDIYGGTYRLLEHYADAYQIHSTYSDFTDVESVITEKTKAIFLETPTNPLLQEVDIEEVSKIAKKHNLLLIVDNTFLTPYLQQPLDLGADIVIHSATKYIGGHNDVLAGVVVAKGEEVCEKLAFFQNSSGAVLSPFDCWLLIRGLKTLPLRFDKQQANAKTIVEFLNNDPGIREVFYPGKGGMISFRVEDPSSIPDFLENLSVISFAESLGGVESFITYPATQTHADIPKEEREERGICDRLLRFSVGTEHEDDLIDDLKHALSAIQKEEIQ
ncbi:methionine biosynthesis PLP-dependent protein [Halobacillus halophilus]|uniref:methionine biosynthesis PLP-dependent protein n=1 Tax=Halobacillus halophilus TaxID=1570 RepID=UPI001CD45C1E|nr:methionine biosynthesis PLP-dependent protein [Halobacillus halophilus]MCA1010347.1 methionine biosynthesis PLP-dependent protein [Halobacillus halophilus]